MLMPVIHCKGCQGILFDSPKPFTKLPKKCLKCGCSEFYVLSDDDVERERLKGLEASGCLISTLLGN